MSNINEEVIYWINFIKNRLAEMRLDATEIFLNGDCGNMFSIFSKIFEDKELTPHCIYYKKEHPYHIVTEIEGRLYDITGETSLEKYCKYLNDNNIKQYNIEDLSEQVTTRKMVEKMTRTI